MISQVETLPSIPLIHGHHRTARGEEPLSTRLELDQPGDVTSVWALPDLTDTIVDPPRKSAPQETLRLGAVARATAVTVRLAELARLLGASRATRWIVGGLAVLGAVTFATVLLAASQRPPSPRIVILPQAAGDPACAALQALADGRMEAARELYRSIDPAKTGCPRAREIVERR